MGGGAVMLLWLPTRGLAAFVNGLGQGQVVLECGARGLCRFVLLSPAQEVALLRAGLL